MATIDRDARFETRTPPEILDGMGRGRTPVAIVGAGPIGLAMAIDLALQGIASVVLDDNDRVSTGSRAICWAKRTLEIFDRLGVGARMVDKGVTWKVGRLFHGADEVYSFDLLPEAGHQMPAFVNLQQYYVEHFLVERCADFPDLIDLRWNNDVVDHTAGNDSVSLTVQTPHGRYTLDAHYMLACDGARSRTRTRMGLPFEGQTFEESFLIADVHMPQSPFGSDVPERWFWFKPPFHEGQSALLHKQPDDIYRIDLQLGPDADADAEKDPARVAPRIRAMVGNKPFTLDWLSVYRFTCARLDQFVHGRVIFVGDSAHVVSPFGARGGNGGIQDVDNLGWKLGAVLKGEAAPTLLNSYDEERIHAADENIANSARATHFMTPKTPAEATLRDAVLSLARDHPFARALINSGRLSTPASLAGLSLAGPTEAGALTSGTPCPDAPIKVDGRPGWLLEQLGTDAIILTIGEPARGIAVVGLPTRHVALEGEPSRPGDLEAVGDVLPKRYGSGLAYLIRPDQHIGASGDAGVLSAAWSTILAGGTASHAPPPAPYETDRRYARITAACAGDQALTQQTARLILLLAQALDFDDRVDEALKAAQAL